jgi:hypothetical protein
VGGVLLGLKVERHIARAQLMNTTINIIQKKKKRRRRRRRKKWVNGIVGKEWVC